MESTKADRDIVLKLAGLYENFLDSDEIESLDKCVADGFAIRDYSHAGGVFLGLAKVKLVELYTT